MAPTVAQTALIFEDPEPAKSPRKSHKRVPSVGDVLRGRRKENESPSAHFSQSARVQYANPSPLGERHINSPPQPKKIPLKDEEITRPTMHKKTTSSASLKGFLMGREKSSSGSASTMTQAEAEEKPKKKKSSTNLASLLKKKSKKDLKENTDAPSFSVLIPSGPQPPRLWAQFATQPLQGVDGAMLYPGGQNRTIEEEIALYTPKDYSEYRPAEQRNFQGYDPVMRDYKPPQRPYLEHRSSRSSIFTENLDEDSSVSTLNEKDSLDQSQSRQISSVSASPKKDGPNVDSSSPEKAKRASRVLDAIATLNKRSQPVATGATDQLTASSEHLSPQEVDSALENVLGRYDIPQNLRDQLRNLKPEVKAGLVKGERIGSGSSNGEPQTPRGRDANSERPTSRDSEQKEGKRSQSRSRPRSRVFSMSKKTKDSSPVKHDGSTRSQSRSRPKSIDLGARPMSAVSSVSTNSLVSLATPDSTTTPGDFIHYLREVQKPEIVEVGKIHKLRILLRNESVSWTDVFVKKGGMDELVQLLYRIMQIEWREEHEDNLLHETLLCLKALSTTQLALQRIEVISHELFPALLKMVFDPERKGPAEFSTRAVIFSLIFAHLSATLHGSSIEHEKRTRSVLALMRDPAPEEDKQPLEFVSQMHVSRPYRIWCKEVVNVTKEVFWIFLHHLNVVPIVEPSHDDTAFSRKFFPTARAPHPAAPYVGGVEWEATQYLATHLDLLNGILVSLPTASERNSLREDLRQSGWEKIMGVSLRTCKEKFYGGVHDGLKAWIAAAKADGWYVEDVRAGPPRDANNTKKSPTKRKGDEPPQLAVAVESSVIQDVDTAWL